MRVIRSWTVAVSATAVSVLCLRQLSLRWGSTAHERRSVLPGDDLLGRAQHVSTRAITIRAKPDDVWPWIAQLGQGRGGFYSYDFLENLIGCNIHSADAVIASWQDVSVGDEVRLHPEVPMVVGLVETNRALVLRGGVPMGSVAAPYEMTWAFVLVAEPGEATRLVVRERYRYHAWWAAFLVEPVSLVSLAMSQRMLRGIKQRVAQSAGVGPLASGHAQ